MKPIRVVQYGTWPYTHSEHTLRSMRSLPDYYEVVGICEPDSALLEKALERPAYQGLKIYTKEEILADKSIDAVIVETDELEQAADSLFFAKAGFNVHSDKPCGASDEVFGELMSCVKEKGLVFQNGYMYRYNPAVVKSLELLRSGELGEIISIEAQMSHCYHGKMLSSLGRLPGGMMFYLGCHLVDLAYQLMGEPEEIIPLNAASGLEMEGVVDFGFVALKYKHGYSLIKTVANEVSGNARRQLVISGTKATVEIKPLEKPTDKIDATCPNEIFMNITRTGHAKDFDSRAERIDFPPYGRYDEMMIDFAKAVRGEKQLAVSCDDEIKIHRMLTKACK